MPIYCTHFIKVSLTFVCRNVTPLILLYLLYFFVAIKRYQISIGVLSVMYCFASSWQIFLNKVAKNWKDK